MRRPLAVFLIFALLFDPHWAHAGPTIRGSQSVKSVSPIPRPTGLKSWLTLRPVRDWWTGTLKPGAQANSPAFLGPELEPNSAPGERVFDVAYDINHTESGANPAARESVVARVQTAAEQTELRKSGGGARLWNRLLQADSAGEAAPGQTPARSLGRLTGLTGLGLIAFNGESQRVRADVPRPAAPSSKLAQAWAKRPRDLHAAKEFLKQSAPARFFKDMLYGEPEVRPYLSPAQQRKIAWYSFALIVAGTLGMLEPRVQGWLIDAVERQAGSTALLWLAALIAMPVAHGLLNAYFHRGMSRIRVAMTKGFRDALLRTLLVQNWAFFAAHKSTELAGRLINDVSMLVNKNINIRASFLYHATMLSVSLTLLVGWGTSELILPVALFSTMMIILYPLYGRDKERNELDLADLRARMIRITGAAMTQEREIKLQRAVDKIAALADVHTEKFKVASNDTTLVATRWDVPIGITGALFVLSILGFGGLARFNALAAGLPPAGTHPTLGDIWANIGYAVLYRESFKGMLSQFAEWRAGTGQTQKVLEISKSDTALKQPSNAHDVGPLKNAIEAKQLLYEKDGKQLLNKLDLTIRHGRRIALVEGRGDDLSFMGNFLTRLADPDGGELRYDGSNYLSINQESLGRRVALIDAQSRMIPGTLRMNMTLNAPSFASDSARDLAIKATLESAQIDLSSFPKGLDTEMDSLDGLSEGQKRRLILARLMLQDPSVVVINAPEAGLTGPDLFRFEALLEQALKGRTIVWIWPKLDQMRTMDEVLVIHDGALAENGTYAELMAKDGVYSRLMSLIHPISAD